MLIGTSTLTKHPQASTLYLTIPASMAKDSQFDLKHGDTVKLIYKTKAKELIIKKEK